MMPRPRPHRMQPDLLDWTPPRAVASFPPRAVQAPNLAGRLARAIGVALAECGRTREEVAEGMTAYLGKPVSVNMVNAYASQAREGHVISTERFVALVHATGDRRLLELLAEPMGWAAIERRYLPLIELAAVRDKQDELGRAADALRRQARHGGLL